MRIKNIIAILATVSSLLISGIAYCDDDLSYDDTVDLIQKTMVGGASDVRMESYGYIRFDKCSMDYKVSGTYPSGGLYDIKFSNIDFSSLNSKESSVGHDYTAFMMLNFKNAFQSRYDFKEISMHTAVINVSNDEKAQILFKSFLHLGELCRAQKSSK